MGRIADVEESRQTTQTERDESAQAQRVGFVPSPVQRGRTGWRIKNDSDVSVSAVEVRTTTGAMIVVYRGSGPDHQYHYFEPVLGAHQSSQLMFRPADSDQAATDSSEVELMTVRFADARNHVWERVGSLPPRMVDP